MLDNANSYGLISGVYGTARPIKRFTASNLFLTKRALLIVGLSGHVGTMYSTFMNTHTQDMVVNKFTYAYTFKQDVGVVGRSCRIVDLAMQVRLEMFNKT